MSEMTKWFPPHIKPVREGIYEIKYTPKNLHVSDMYATWNGARWSVGSYNRWDYNHTDFDGNQNKYWRGFKEKQA